VCEHGTPVEDMRVVSLSPAMTEVMYALGAEDVLVGVTTFCDFPERAQHKTAVGDFSNPSIERIVALKPRLVVINLPEQARVQRQLEQLHIPVFASSPTSLRVLYAEITELGRLLSRQSAAESLVSYMQARIRPTAKAAKRVYIELAPRPLVTVGGQSYLNEMIEMAGGVNIFSDLAQPYPVVGQEAIIQRDPEVIIVLHPERIADRLGWQRITAVKNGTIYTDLDEDLLMRPGPRLVEGFRLLVKCIHE
jgi:iron complex transport system substrate-binding protein